MVRTDKKIFSQHTMMVCVGLDLFFVSSLRALKKHRIFCNFFDWEWRDVEKSPSKDW